MLTNRTAHVWMRSVLAQRPQLVALVNEGAWQRPNQLRAPSIVVRRGLFRRSSGLGDRPTRDDRLGEPIRLVYGDDLSDAAARSMRDATPVGATADDTALPCIAAAAALPALTAPDAGPERGRMRKAGGQIALTRTAMPLLASQVYPLVARQFRRSSERGPVPHSSGVRWSSGSAACCTSSSSRRTELGSAIFRSDDLVFGTKELALVWFGRRSGRHAGHHAHDSAGGLTNLAISTRAPGGRRGRMFSSVRTPPPSFWPAHGEFWEARPERPVADFPIMKVERVVRDLLRAAYGPEAGLGFRPTCFRGDRTRRARTPALETGARGGCGATASGRGAGVVGGRVGRRLSVSHVRRHDSKRSCASPQ